MSQNEKGTGAEIEDDDDGNWIAFNDGIAGVKISSLDKISNGTPSNGSTSSYRATINSDVEHEDNSPGRKRKINLDTWSTIKRIKNNDLLTSDKEGITHVREKFSVMIKYSKDKRKVICLTARSVIRTKKWELDTQHQ